jgi:hypothetical protein
MRYIHPGELKRLIKNNADRLVDSGVMQIQKKRMEFALENIDKIPKVDDVKEAIAFIEEEAGIILTDVQFLAILSLFPVARVELAEYGWGDTEVRSHTLDVIAKFFLSAYWPMYMDEFDIDEFVAVLKKAAQFMGYQVKQ